MNKQCTNFSMSRLYIMCKCIYLTHTHKHTHKQNKGCGAACIFSSKINGIRKADNANPILTAKMLPTLDPTKPSCLSPTPPPTPSLLQKPLSVLLLLSYKPSKQYDNNNKEKRNRQRQQQKF